MKTKTKTGAARGLRSGGTRLPYTEAAAAVHRAIRLALEARVEDGRPGGERGLSATEWAVFSALLDDGPAWGFWDCSLARIDDLAERIGKSGHVHAVRQAVATLIEVGVLEDGPHGKRESVPFLFVVGEGQTARTPDGRPDSTQAATDPHADDGTCERVHAAFAEAERAIRGTPPEDIRRTRADDGAVAKALAMGFTPDQLVRAMKGIRSMKFLAENHKPIPWLLRNETQIQDLLVHARTRSGRHASSNIGEFSDDSRDSTVARGHLTS